MSFIRCVVTGVAAVLFAGTCHAGTVEDWLVWRLQEHERELVQQLGLEFIDEATVDDLLSGGPSVWLAAEPIEPPGELVLRRTLAPPRIALAASIFADPAPGWQLGLTLTLSMRRVFYRQIRHRPVPAAFALKLPERSGNVVLDGVLWRLAEAECQARSQAQLDASQPAGRGGR